MPEEELVRVCNEIRRRLGVPVEIVTAGGSGVRCPTHNANVGGMANSLHLTGNAADLFPSENLAPVLGFEGYRDIILKMREKGAEIPLVAIGGITKEDIPQLLECGVSGIALSGSIINAENPVLEMADVIEILTK